MKEVIIGSNLEAGLNIELENILNNINRHNNCKLLPNKTKTLSPIRYIENKDEKLHELVKHNLGNVAQFISFKPSKEDLKQNFAHIMDVDNVSSVKSIEEKIKLLINSSSFGAVNIRSFSPEKMKGSKFVYGKRIEDIDEIMEIVKMNSKEGMYSIVNENIDVSDGGVSGVIMGNLIEFSPNDTPKCVDKEGVCSLPRRIGIGMLEIVYGFTPDLDYDLNYRIEFSIHPKRQGVLNEHTIIWEYEHCNNCFNECKIQWTNNFSEFIGNKTFGLLVADLLGLNVPKTTVISRNVAPFTFGQPTGTYEKWIRTSPAKKEPGKYYTGFGWTDPFELINNEEERCSIVSVLSQNAVNALYSGAAFIRENEKNDLIEGVSGVGDLFMTGEEEKINLPTEVLKEVRKTCKEIREFIRLNLIDEISIEWVYDGNKVWVVQMNQLDVGTTKKDELKQIIVNGTPSEYKKVYVRDGLENLRNIIEKNDRNDIGINLIGNIGITSHFGDLLRLANIPSYLTKE